MKTYDVTIQMKALCLYFHICFSKFYKINEIWKSGRNLPLATFGGERVKSKDTWQYKFGSVKAY